MSSPVLSVQPIRLGISACLLGQNVRYDGGHKRDSFLCDTLGPYVTYVPVCPEVEAGFGVPREAMRLVGDPAAPRLITIRTQRDMTDRMRAWAAQRVRELETEDLHGFIFKARSPSSGMERVKVYDANGVPAAKGVGLFARAFMDHFPLLPVEEEGRLQDPNLRENFIERLFTLQRWRTVRAAARPLAALVDFHTRHKYLILSHSPSAYARLGRLVAEAKGRPAPDMFREYETILLPALTLTATPAKHANVLQHMLGFFKKDLTPDEKQELLDVIQDYRQARVPLIVPVTLLAHYVRKYRQPYLAEQVYLHPHPAELALRNHA
jgi:uncharacterized protein YbgA (DUF1722 family)/uncharacterized protein YbbK (DUF523 family)